MGTIITELSRSAGTMVGLWIHLSTPTKLLTEVGIKLAPSTEHEYGTFNEQFFFAFPYAQISFIGHSINTRLHPDLEILSFPPLNLETESIERIPR